MTPDTPAAGREARLRALLPLFRRSGGEIESVLLGSSMAPAIPDGALIRIRCTGVTECRIGEIVVASAGGRLIAHRVAYRGRRPRTSRYILTRGDALWLPDPPVAIDALLGRVTAVRKGDEWSSPDALAAGLRRAEIPLTVLGLALELSVSLARGLGITAVAARRLYLGLRRAIGRKRGGRQLKPAPPAPDPPQRPGA